MTKKTTKHKLKRAFVVLLVSMLVVSFAFYFYARFKFGWVQKIVPEFMGITVVGLLLLFLYKRSMKLRTFVIVSAIIASLSIVGFIGGNVYGIPFLVDLTPEILGVTLIATLFSVFLGEKTWV